MFSVQFIEAFLYMKVEELYIQEMDKLKAELSKSNESLQTAKEEVKKLNVDIATVQKELADSKKVWFLFVLCIGDVIVVVRISYVLNVVKVAALRTAISAKFRAQLKSRPQNGPFFY